MPRRGKRSQAQKIRWRKFDLEDEQTRPSRINQVEQASTSAAVPQFSGRTYLEGGDTASRVVSVRASHCQGDFRYASFSRNHQCTCVALTFLANQNEGIAFKRPDLDRVLEEGDALYISTKLQLIAEGQFNFDHLTMEEVPLRVSSFNRTYNVLKSGVMHGYLRAPGTEEWLIPLTERLQCLSTDVSYALLIVSPECIAVFRDRSGRYGYFDSHSRTAAGLPHPNGTAVMLTFTHLGHMADRMLKIFWDRGAETSYEFMPVSFEAEQQSGQLPSPSVCEQTSQGISAPEPAELVCTGTQNQDVVVKTNKHRRRKELRKTFKMAEQCRELITPALPYATRKHKKRDCERRRYATSSQYQSKRKAAKKVKYNRDDDFRNKMKRNIVRRYSMDAVFRRKMKECSKKRYSTDYIFQRKKKEYIRKRYSTDSLFRKKMKEFSKKRYSTDYLFQRKKRECVRKRYSTDSLFQSKMKAYMARRYAGDPEFRAHHILRCTLHKTKRCASDTTYHILHRLQCALRIKNKYKSYIRSSQERPQPLVSKEMESAIHAFRCKIQRGPTHVCTVCHRALFPDQVRVCHRARYDKNAHVAAACLTGKYVHTCDSACSGSCVVPEERKQEWICPTCDSHLKRGQMSSIAAANKMELPPIPAELDDLNVLERQLIAKILPFAKIVTLPKGQQRAVRGAVVCVPSEMENTVNSLPRPRSEAQLLQVKLKRRVNFKGYQQFNTVNMHNVLSALSKLKAVHSEYRDISIRDSAVFESPLDENSDVSESHLDEEANVPEIQMVADAAEQDEMQTEADAAEQDEQHVSVEEKDELRPGLTLDTCMQPPDIGQEILSYGEGIFSIAPAQGHKPVGFFKIPKLEAMAFPVQFPTGQNSIDEERQISISPSMYFNARLFSVDTRFAKDQSYLFFAQFVTETHLARNSMSIQLRKGKPVTRDGRENFEQHASRQPGD
ncbi:hypothetical protein F2P79_023725 [Pimephales promelas]|nr:hypothetical protein F2P79_023725 [Pimephales promelas]